MRRLLLANLPEKLASLIIAALLWQVVLRIEQPVTEGSFDDIPVSYINIPEGLVLTQRVGFVRVDAQVVSPTLTAIDKSAIQVVVDLSQAKPGRNLYQLIPRYSGKTTDGVVLTARPKRAEVVLENYTSRQVPVVVSTTGAWDLYRPGPISVSPTRVTVSGAQSKVNAVAQARATVNLNSIEPGSATEAQIQLLNSDGKPSSDVTVDPQMVAVQIKPVSLPPEKNVLVQPIWRGSPEFGYRVDHYEIDPVQVRVRGLADRLANLTSVDTQQIDISNLNADKIFKVILAPPQGVLPDRREVQVKVYIRKDDTVSPPR